MPQRHERGWGGSQKEVFEVFSAGLNANYHNGAKRGMAGSQVFGFPLKPRSDRHMYGRQEVRIRRGKCCMGPYITMLEASVLITLTSKPRMQQDLILGVFFSSCPFCVVWKTKKSTEIPLPSNWCFGLVVRLRRGFPFALYKNQGPGPNPNPAPTNPTTNLLGGLRNPNSGDIHQSRSPRLRPKSNGEAKGRTTNLATYPLDYLRRLPLPVAQVQKTAPLRAAHFFPPKSLYRTPTAQPSRPSQPHLTKSDSW